MLRSLWRYSSGEGRLGAVGIGQCGVRSDRGCFVVRRHGVQCTPLCWFSTVGTPQRGEDTWLPPGGPGGRWYIMLRRQQVVPNSVQVAVSGGLRSADQQLG